jgi:cell cycle protein kinase DBF2
LADKKHRVSNLQQLKALPFFAKINWDTLREIQAPFIPTLDSDADAGYVRFLLLKSDLVLMPNQFDNFEDPADMAKYAEVKEKQRNVDAVKEKEEPVDRAVWIGFTFKPHGKIDEAEVLGMLPSRSESSSSLADQADGTFMP